jgi:CMP-N-acetylneuraminic acid synthetase
MKGYVNVRKYFLIIPARGGSKGIPKKNIVLINGRPLIWYSIDVANKLIKEGVIYKAIVSTDSQEIADISKSFGIEVPFLRPKNISSDNSKSIEYILHALSFYRGKNIDIESVILLQPTSPLRSYEDVVNAMKIYENTASESLISVYREDYICDLVCYKKDGDLAIPLSKDHNAGVRRQEHEKLYVRNGAIYITDAKYLIEKKCIVSDKPAMYEMPKNKSINLDTVEDLEMLRWILK